jgi:signal transduction histidine kinase
LTLVSEWSDLSALLADSVPESARAWLVNEDGWVLADSGPAHQHAAQQTTWLQRWFYRLVAGNRTAIESAAIDRQVRLQSGAVLSALAGKDGRDWSQDADTAVLRNSVAVPVWLEQRIRGAIVLQSASEGLLLVTNRALGRLLITTLALTFGLAGGLWYFATRLSQRVRRLGGAVSKAMEDGVAAEVLPLTSDRDELGALARNNQKLLRAVTDYNQYLQTLAGKLSHELHTPLAITRSSLDNLSSRPLDAEARRFLQRAQEGVERQAAIVRTMSEANRLEAAIRVAEWEQTDLVQLVMKSAASYRTVHPLRNIETDICAQAVRLRCAPELLAQALDKLVDNAITLSGEADVITIALTLNEEEVQLVVRNSGTRLPAEFQERIFDSLVSVREKRSTTHHLGLGLYIVRLVAAAHGGSVNACNLPQDQGVEFVIHLPTPR